MQLDSFANVVDQSTATDFHEAAISRCLQSPPVPELTMLLDRCRGDLIFVDSLLCELESIQPSDRTAASAMETRPEGVSPSRMPHRFATALTTIGADLIRRLADDIEDLCRTSARGIPHEMLVDLQVKLVRCLRMLPATANITSN